MEEITKIIKKNEWNGKPLVIVHSYYNNVNNKLNKTIFKMLKKEYQNDFIFCIDLKNKKESLKEITNYIKLCNSNKSRFIISNLSKFKYPEAIINIFYSAKNINAILLSDYNIEKLLKKNATLCRGKYDKLFLPPSLYEYKNKYNEHLHIEFLNHKKNYKDIYETYKFILNNVGKKMTYNHIHKYILKERGLPYLIKIINELVNYGIIYLISNTNLKNETTLTNSGITIYLAFPEDLLFLSKKDNKYLKLENYSISKLLDQKYEISAASTFMRYNTNKGIKFGNGLVKSFFVKKDNIKFLIKFDYGESEEEKARFIKLKTNIKKIIVYIGDANLIIGEDNISYVGINKFVEKGLSINEGI